ncbi:MAG TPA: hypothetical protein PKB13_14265 [Clostridia bacterium]|nr:hypothetical protein [Clostridia bacterium]
METLENLPELLNGVYEPLCARSKALCSYLKEQGVTFTRGFYNLHAVRKGDGFFTEHFPIPVVTAQGLGDFGFELDHIFFEAVLPREKALCFDFAALARGYNIEVYGAEDFLTDFYHTGMDMAELRERLLKSAEREVCLCLKFACDTPPQTLFAAAKTAVFI